MNAELLKLNLDSVAKDTEGRLSLTDLHKLSGKSRNFNPCNWIRLESTKLLIETVGDMLNTPKCILNITKGRIGRTFAHKQIFLSYAKYLSPKIHFQVNQVFFERLEAEKNMEIIIHYDINPESMSQKTYLMIENRNGLIKIGKSKDPVAREKTLQSEDPQIKLIHIIDRNVENELHIKFRNKRVRGEWFNLSDEDVSYIKLTYAQAIVKSKAA